MERPRVRLLNDPVLRHVAEEVGAEYFPLLSGLIHTMYEVMKDEGGIGLAANQIGSGYRVFVLGLDGNNEDFINPEIVSAAEPVDFEEGCLSIPGVTAKTKRFSKVTLRFQTARQGPENWTTTSYEGIKAIAIQHEMDHLNGKLYIDMFGPVKRGMVVDKHRKFMRLKARS